MGGWKVGPEADQEVFPWEQYRQHARPGDYTRSVILGSRSEDLDCRRLQPSLVRQSGRLPLRRRDPLRYDDPRVRSRFWCRLSIPGSDSRCSLPSRRPRWIQRPPYAAQVVRIVSRSLHSRRARIGPGPMMTVDRDAREPIPRTEFHLSPCAPLAPPASGSSTVIFASPGLLDDEYLPRRAGASHPPNHRCLRVIDISRFRSVR